MTEEAIFIGVHEAVETDKYRTAKDIFSGTVGGIAQVLVGQPFDTVKVRLAADTTGQYRGAGDVVKKLLVNEGFRGFYKGTLTPLIGVGACVSIQFSVNEYMKRVTFKGGKDLSSTQYYISGVAAGLANSVVACPIEHIRIRLQTQITGKLGPLDVIRKIYGHSGVSGIFRGLVPNAIREAHGIGLYFLSYEWLIKKDTIKNSIERSDIPGGRLCLYGAASGLILWLGVYPVDLVKSRLQTDSLEKPVYKGSLDVIKSTWKTQGIKGFFKGFTPTILRAAPANAATFYAFELTMRALG